MKKGPGARRQEPKKTGVGAHSECVVRDRRRNAAVDFLINGE
jgi:hypothetical protein